MHSKHHHKLKKYIHLKHYFSLIIVKKTFLTQVIHKFDDLFHRKHRILLCQSEKEGKLFQLYHFGKNSKNKKLMVSVFKTIIKFRYLWLENSTIALIIFI